MAFLKTKRNISQTDSNTEFNEFPKFIELESMNKIPLKKLSPFLIEKVISSRAKFKSIKKIRNGNLLVKVTEKKHADSLLNMEKFHYYKYKAYPHERLNSCNGVIRSQELSLATEEEIKTVLRKQGVMNHRRISIKRNGKRILTNTDILTFNSSTIPKEIKIGFTIETVELYILAPLWCFKYQKLGHHKDICREQQICGKCGETNPSHYEDESEKEMFKLSWKPPCIL